MNNTTRAGLWTLFLASLFLVLPRGAAAQGTPQWLGEQAPALNSFDAQVMAPVIWSTSTPFREALKEVARQHQAIANLRTANDVDRFECLQKQAAMLYYTGDLQGAQNFMKRAAEHAATMGHVYEAAMAYVDAALVANQAGNGTAALYFAAQARQLSQFGFLSSDQRQAIQGRLVTNQQY